MTTYIGIIDRPTTITIDGYSSAKTINGVMHDIAKIMKKVHPFEESTFQTTNKTDAQALLGCTPEVSSGGFFVTIESVPCAAQYNENKDEVEYKDGYNYYFCTRIVK